MRLSDYYFNKLVGAGGSSRSRLDALQGRGGDRRDIDPNRRELRNTLQSVLPVGRLESREPARPSIRVPAIRQPAVVGRVSEPVQQRIPVVSPIRPVSIPETTAPVILEQREVMQPVGVTPMPAQLPSGTIVQPDPNNPGRFSIYTAQTGWQHQMTQSGVDALLRETGGVTPPIVQTGSGGGEMATDWGQLLGNVATSYIDARYSGGGPVQAQPAFLPPPLVGAIGSGMAGGALGALAESFGLGLPGVDVVSTGDATKGKLYNPRTGKWERCRRRRRKLLTDGDFKCLASLKTLTGNNDAFKAAVIRAVR